MQLLPPERPTAIAAVPVHFRHIVSTHVEIAEVFEKREIENDARRIAGLDSREERAAALAKVSAVKRDRVRARAIEMFDKSMKGGEQ